MKKIGQSTTFPLARNTITVTLSASVAIGGSQPVAITLSGLRHSNKIDADTVTNRVLIQDRAVTKGFVSAVTSSSIFTLSSTAEAVDGFYVGYEVPAKPQS
jgi:hypothetical protein